MKHIFSYLVFGVVIAVCFAAINPAIEWHYIALHGGDLNNEQVLTTYASNISFDKRFLLGGLIGLSAVGFLLIVGGGKLERARQKLPQNATHASSDFVTWAILRLFCLGIIASLAPLFLYFVFFSHHFSNDTTTIVHWITFWFMATLLLLPQAAIREARKLMPWFHALLTLVYLKLYLFVLQKYGPNLHPNPQMNIAFGLAGAFLVGKTPSGRITYKGLVDLLQWLSLV